VRLLTVCGSLQAKSGNLSLLRAASSLAPTGVDVVHFEGLGALPLFNPDLDEADPTPPVKAWRRALADADVVLFASPEYGHSLPGGLKNGIDWVIGSGELYRKIVAITAAVPHASRGRLGLAALAQTLGAVEAVLVWQEPTVRGPGSDDAVRDIIRALMQAASQRHT